MSDLVWQLLGFLEVTISFRIIAIGLELILKVPQNTPEVQKFQ